MQESLRFNGDDYIPERDNPRLATQLQRVYAFMKDGQWRTLTEIESATRTPAASASAQLRHLRKPRFGGYTVEKRHRGDERRGLYEYRVLGPDGPYVVETNPL